jgi:ABC-type sugar transport system permease subunit
MKLQNIFKPRSVLGKQQGFATRTLTPIMLYTIFFSLLPMIWAVALSFYNYSPVRKGDGLLGMGGANPFIGLGNYFAMFAQTQPARVFRTAVVNSFIFALIVLPLNLVITLPIATLIESVHERMKGIFRTIYFLPVVTSSVAVSLIWTYIYNPQMGFLNTFIKSIGLIPPRTWLGDPNALILNIPLAMIAIIVTYIWWDFGYNMVIFIAALQSIPKEFHDAARIDGANPWQEFFFITIPLLMRTIQFVCVMTVLSAMQVFDIFWVMTQGGPQDQTTPLVLAIYKSAFKSQDMGWAAAVSMVLFAIILVVTLFQRRLLRTDWEY